MGCPDGGGASRGKDITALQDILARAERSTAAHDIEQMMLLDREFHLTLARATRNDVLAEILRKLHERSLRFWFISLVIASHHGEVHDEHQIIVKAIKSRDLDAAEGAMRSHIESFRRSITHIVKPPIAKPGCCACTPRKTSCRRPSPTSSFNLSIWTRVGRRHRDIRAPSRKKFWRKWIFIGRGNTGSRTRLLRFDPVVNPAPFVHDHWEEVYLVSGDLTVGSDAQGNGGEVFRRRPTRVRPPPGVYHGPFKSSGGCGAV